eukprot:PhF_6_TR35986/c0_g1_i1/m.52103/K10290/FBXO3; F-box protein 3
MSLFKLPLEVMGHVIIHLRYTEVIASLIPLNRSMYAYLKKNDLLYIFWARTCFHPADSIDIVNNCVFPKGGGGGGSQLIRTYAYMGDILQRYLRGAAPEILGTLEPPASRDDIRDLIVAFNDPSIVALPPDLLALYSLTRGQSMTEVSNDMDPIARLDDSISVPNHEPLEPALRGLFGGYRCYDHAVNLHLCSIPDAIQVIQGAHRRSRAPPILTKGVMLASDVFGNVVYFVVVTPFEGHGVGTVVASTMTGAVIAISATLTHWVRDWVKGLHEKKYIQYRRELWRFPLGESREVTTRGVTVTATPLFIPERSQIGQSNFFAYCIRMWTKPENMSIPPCQLTRRHWEIQMCRDDGEHIGNPEIVEGDGVIGLYPKMPCAYENAFQYCSCTNFKTKYGKMGGYFVMRGQGGGSFNVEVPEFVCRVKLVE